MRIHLSVVILSVLGSAIIGYFVGRRGNGIGSSVETGSRSAGSQASVVGTASRPTEAVSPEESMFNNLRNRAAAMSDEEFGMRFAQLLAAANSAETTVGRAALLSAIDGPKALAAYLAFKKSQGIPLNSENMAIREMLTVAGQKDGSRAMDLFLANAPEFNEISSLMHGWALQDPNAAANWFNNLPSNFASQHGCLSGLVYAIGQKDPKVCRNVFAQLSSEDQLDSADSVARSLFLAHGCEAVDQVMADLPAAVVRKGLEAIFERIERRPLTEVVPWLADQVGQGREIARSPAAATMLVKRWRAWNLSDPAAASAWRSSAVSANPQLEQMLAEEKP